MAKSNTIKLLRNRSAKIYSNGTLLSEYKFYGNPGKKYYTEPQVYDTNMYNSVQSFLYKRALYGLSIYNKTEIKALPVKEKNMILQLQERTQKELNLWKQELIIQRSNALLALFPRSPLAHEIIDDDYQDPLLANTFSFRDLGLSKEDVVKRLHRAGILPPDFYEINQQQ